MTRPSWDKYWMDMCDLVATRATCDRKKVGCLIIKNNQLLSAGFNGSLQGLPHCDDVGHDLDNGHCIRVNHSESNAICSAARRGVATEGATVYCNLYPCWSCFKLIISSGIIEVVYKEDYGNEWRITEALKQLKNFRIRKWQ